MSATWKTVRVFISSTFRDMQAERDHLVRFVFPRLREELLKRRIHFVDVDLRWGVTSEQDSLQVCKEIIDECRPRFLCVLGGRYGWTPPGREESITAAEVRHGVLDRLGRHGYAFFYLRDPRVTDSIPEEAARSGGYREFPQPDEIAQLGPQEAREMARRRSVKLRLLKRAIGKAGLQPFVYPAKWNDQEGRLAGLEAFGQRVYDHLLHSIDDEFGAQPAAQLDEFAEENAAMEAFVEERSERFVLGSREAVLEELLAHAGATGGNGYVCLTGAPGSGKSALLAHLYKALTSPPLPLQSAIRNLESAIVLPHFVGASPGSTDVRRTLRRLCHELKGSCPDITADIPDDPEKLRVAFPDFLRQACARRRVVILLDAVNQFDPASHSAGLHWLPEDLPESARVILSALDGPALEELRRRPRRPREIELEPLTAADGEAIVQEFLHRCRKTMTDAQRAALLAKTDAGTPLYLLAALEELRTLGTYEEITDHICDLPSQMHPLFIWILKRLEADPGFRDAIGCFVGADLVRKFCSCVGVSRHGLTYTELADLIAPGDPKADPPIPADAQGNVAALIRLLRLYLMHRGELLDFYHSQFGEVAKTRYSPTEQDEHDARLRLSDYFSAQERSSRRCNELPWLLAKTKSWQRLYDLLADLAFFEALWEENQFDLKIYWAAVESNSPLRLVAAYKPVLERPDARIASYRTVSSDADIAELVKKMQVKADAEEKWKRELSGKSVQVKSWKQSSNQIACLAQLFIDTDHLPEAVILRRSLLEESRHGGSKLEIAGAAGNLAVLLGPRGDVDGAVALHQEEERLFRELGHKGGLARCVGNQVLIHLKRGDLAKATACQEVEERLFRELADRHGLAIALSHKANLLYRRDDLAGAMTAHGECQQVFKELGDKGRVAKCLHDQAVICSHWGQMEQALTLLQSAESVFRELGMRAMLDVCLRWQSDILLKAGNRDRAVALLEEAEPLTAELASKDTLTLALCKQAEILVAGGDKAGAIRVYEKMERAARGLKSTEWLVLSLGNRGVILKDSGQAEEALPLLQEAAHIARETGDKDGLQNWLHNLAGIRHGKGDLAGALALWREQGEICRDLGNREALARSLGNQAGIVFKQGDAETALALFRQQEEICRDIRNENGLAMCLGNQALVFKERNDLDSAMRSLKEQEQICRKLGDRSRWQVNLSVQAAVASARGDMDSALALCREEERLCRELREKDELRRCLENQARILKNRGDFEGVRASLREQEQICRELEDEDGLQACLGDEGAILQEQGALDHALVRYKEQEQICRKLGLTNGLSTSLGNQATLLIARSDFSGALKLLSEAEQAARAAGNKEELSRNLANHAQLLIQELHQPAEAVSVGEEAFRLATELGNAARVDRLRKLVAVARSVARRMGAE